AQAPVRPATARPHTLRCPQSPVRPRPVRPCWSGTGHRHVPGCLHGSSCRTGHRSDSQLLPSLSRVTPSAASEHVSELLGYPISRPLAACCVCLELRPLPSTGITLLQRYCEPLRPHSAPGLSLARPYQPSPEGLPGRPAHRPFRGLLSVHSRCGPHTRAVTVYRDQLSEGFRHFVSSMPAPV